MFVQGGKQTYNHKKTNRLLPHDRKIIVKVTWMIHQPTLDTIHKINKESGLHQSPLWEDILSINVSICHCPGAARGAWKHAPIILLPRHIIHLNHAACSHHFLTSKHPWVISVVSLLVRLVPLTIHNAFNTLPLS